MALLKVTDRGIYCEAADVYIDPWKPVNKAFITHAHADHSRKGHSQYVAHEDSVPIMKYRLGRLSVKGMKYGETIEVNGVKFSFHPAGHIIGSSQIRVEYKGQIWVASGDYKTENDGISTPIEIVKCHGFITESTFGIPAFKWQKQESVINEIHEWWIQNQKEGNISIIAAYSLGKAQRLIHNLDHSIGKIYAHTAIYKTNKVIRNHGISLPETEQLNMHTTSKALIGNLLLAPPGAIGAKWLYKIKPVIVAAASGWMGLRGMRRRRSVDKGFVLSDHADWSGLLDVIKNTGATEVMVTHGYQEIFSRYLCELGYNAYTEKTAFEGELITGESKNEDSLDDSISENSSNKEENKSAS